MITKTNFLFFVITTVFSVGVRAQTPAVESAPVGSTSSWSVTATPAVVSQYMFRGVRLGGPSFEPAIEAGNGVGTLGLWANVPIEDKVPGVSDPEFDFYGSYAIKVSDSLTLLPGFTYYYYPDADTSAGFYHSTFEPSLALSYTAGAFKITPKVYFDLTLDGPTYELAAAYTVPLKNVGTELSFTGTVGTFIQKDVANNSSPAVKNWGDYWLLGVSAPFAITGHSKLTLGFAYTAGNNNYFKQGSAPRTVNTAALGRGVATVNYAWTF